MTSPAFSRPAIWGRFQDFWKSCIPSRDCLTPLEGQQDKSRAMRDIALEMLDRNPDAFQSELDIQAMAHMYRCKF